MLTGEHELRVGEHEAVAVAEHADGPFTGGLVPGTVGSDELLRLAPVVLEAGTIRKLTHDESPLVAPGVRSHGRKRSRLQYVVLGGVGTSLPADRMRLRAHYERSASSPSPAVDSPS